jgi:ATP-binding cassette subfamily B protein
VTKRFKGYQDDPDVISFDFTYLRRLSAFIRPYAKPFAACLVILFLSFALALVGPRLIRLAIDGPIADAVRGDGVETDTLWILGGAYLLATVLSVGLGYWYGILTALNGQRVVRDVRVALFSRLMNVSPRFYDRNPAGKIVTRVTTDVENLNDLISTGVLQALFDLLKILGILVWLFFVSPELALVTLCATPIIIVTSLMSRRFLRQSYRLVRSRLARQNAFAGESIGGVRVTRAFRQESAVNNHFGSLNAATRTAWIQTVFHFSLFFSLVDLTIRLTQVGILWTGGSAIIDGSLSVGRFLEFWLLFGMLAEPIRELGEKYNVLQSAMASCERIFGILDEPVSPPINEQALVSEKGSAHICIENISFAYSKDYPVIRNVSFEIPAGETHALVGPTGSGKSTLLALLSRLHDPDQGRILIDGIDIKNLDLRSLRRRIAVVQQEVFLFTGTILDNIRLFDGQISEARVLEALQRVGAMDFVKSLEGGLGADVAERGATFSQGEKQLLSFARALVTDPDVLVLDEATASIDSRSEALIHKGLRELLRNRTCLIVAHRLSTIRNADRIIVLQQGQILETGSHSTLMAKDGAYATMTRLA